VFDGRSLSGRKLIGGVRLWLRVVCYGQGVHPWSPGYPCVRLGPRHLLCPICEAGSKNAIVENVWVG
jgi:hypothetical protein